MSRLIISIAMLIWCLIGLLFSLFMAVDEGLSDLGAGLLAFVEFILSGKTSVVERSHVWHFTTLCTGFATTCCFWWVVRELVLRYERAR